MLFCDVIDELHDEHGFSDACTAEQTDLAALGIGTDEVDDLDAGFENFGFDRLLVIRRGGSVDFPAFSVLRRGLFVNRLAEDVENSAEGFGSDGYADGLAGIDSLRSAHQTVRGAHRDASCNIVSDVP